MSPEQWKKVADLLEEAVRRAPADRRRWLEQACVGDEMVLREVEKLIAAHEQAGDFLEQPLLARETTTVPAVLTDGPSRHAAQALGDFGAYHVLGVLGEGGMGVVYLVETREPVRRRVALKVLKRHEDQASFIARFESESQALALMEHPNIARVYDAGATPDGRSYFAMEYVPGIPITEYCDRNLLGFRERLMLFQQVCQAVQHAHQKGIIHRDLKPSNVLVMLQDGKAMPKVIDFGVAKATNQRLTEKTLFTEVGVLIGTPEYMSPEQADLTTLDIDSTTDVYSLGVLLYELLVGALPFDPKTLRKAGYAEIQRLIREEEPPKPTTRLSGMGRNAEEVARHRRSDVRTLIRLLRGDLEWITMKALEKDRTRRYASASEFAADLGRHLANEPVMAGPPAVGYRVRKFVRRHRGLVAAGITVALALLIGATVSFLLYLRAVQGEDAAEIESYSANLSAADVFLRAGQAGEAKLRLAAVPASLRGWEWHHLIARTDESQATVYWPEFQGNEIHMRFPEMRFSEDGAQLFSYGDSFLRSWDLATKRVGTELSGLGRILAVGPQGKTVLTGPLLEVAADAPAEGFALRLYEVSTRRLLGVFRGLAKNPGTATISDDGTRVAAAEDISSAIRIEPSAIIVWDARTGEPVARLEGHPDWITNIRFSPDGRVLASASLDKTVQLWDASTGRKRATLQHSDGVKAICFARDGRWLASGSLSTVSIWDTQSGRLVRNWKVGSGEIFAVAFSSDASVLATSSGSALRIWDAANGQLRNEYIGAVSTLGLAFHPTAPRLYSHGNGGLLGAYLKEWDLGHRGPVLESTAPVASVSVSPDGKYIASGSRDGMVRIYAADSLNLLRSLAGHRGEIAALAFSPDSTLLASGSHDKTIKLWTVPEGRLIRSLAGHTDLVWSVAFFPDGSRILSGSEDLSIRIWSLGSDTAPVTIPMTSPITSLAITPDGHTIVALQRVDKSISLLDAESKKILAVLSTHSPEINPIQPRSMSLSPDGKIAIGPANSGSALAIWDLRNRKQIDLLPAFGEEVDSIASLAISPDGSRVAVGGQFTGNLSIWDLRKKKRLAAFNGHSSRVRSLAWTPDGTRLVSGSLDRTVRVWDSRSTYNHEAELLVEKLSGCCLLAEEKIRALERDRSIPAELRQAAVQLANQRGNASYPYLLEEAWRAGLEPKPAVDQYAQAMRRATVGAQLAPGYGWGQLTLALLQYRTGDFSRALLSAQRAMDIQKLASAEGHAIRAMAYERLNDRVRARTEVLLARQTIDTYSERTLIEEAERLILPRK